MTIESVTPALDPEMTSRSNVVLISMSSFILGALCGVLALMTLGYARAQPAIVIQPATRSESLEVHLPKEKWDQRDAIATSLAAIDLPTRLKLESPEYSEFSAKWEEESAKQMAMPSGENMIDVVLMQPRFIATDARDVVTTHCAELLNRDVEQTLAAILNEAVKDWQLEQSLSIR